MSKEIVVKKKYGEFENVLLSDDEYKKLKSRYPDMFLDYIERLSLYLESKGAKYKSHYATILNWIRRDCESGKKNIRNKATGHISTKPTYDLNQIKADAMANTSIKGLN